MDAVVSGGFTDLMKLGPVITILCLIIIALCWFIKSLLQDAKEERKLNRDALVSNTQVISEFKELIRNALHQS